jgi:peptidoglycan/LPS O-acetylase OafA/YrhL
MQPKSRFWTEAVIAAAFSLIAAYGVAYWLEELDDARIAWAGIVVWPAALLSFVFGNIHQGNDRIFRWALRIECFAAILLLVFCARQVLKAIVRRKPLGAGPAKR